MSYFGKHLKNGESYNAADYITGAGDGAAGASGLSFAEILAGDYKMAWEPAGISESGGSFVEWAEADGGPPITIYNSYGPAVVDGVVDMSGGAELRLPNLLPLDSAATIWLLVNRNNTSNLYAILLGNSNSTAYLRIHRDVTNFTPSWTKGHQENWQPLGVSALPVNGFDVIRVNASSSGVAMAVGDEAEVTDGESFDGSGGGSWMRLGYYYSTYGFAGLIAGCVCAGADIRDGAVNTAVKARLRSLVV